MGKLLENLVRLGFAGWVAFELLNYFGVLKFSLDFTWLGLVLTSGFVWLAMEVINSRLTRKSGSGLPWFIFAIGLFGVSWDALGDVAHWYSHFSWYDQVGHFNGGAMAALIFFFIFYRLLESGQIKMGYKLLGFFAFCGGTFLGVLYELEEYLEDVVTGGNRSGLGTDTANDLMWNTMGGLLVVLIAVRIVKVISLAKGGSNFSGEHN